MFLLQMSGFPGSGKSTLAKEISKHIDVVVVDRDVIKSSMIASGVDLDIVASSLPIESYIQKVLNYIDDTQK